MKKNKLVMGLSTIVLVASLGGGLAFAKSGAPQQSITDGDTVMTQNDRQKTPHSAKKEAAKRLKVEHQQEVQQHKNDGANAHQGQNGSEHGLENNKTPKSSQRGAQ